MDEFILLVLISTHYSPSDKVVWRMNYSLQIIHSGRSVLHVYNKFFRWWSHAWSYTTSIPIISHCNCRVKAYSVWPCLYNKIIAFMTSTKYHYFFVNYTFTVYLFDKKTFTILTIVFFKDLTPVMDRVERRLSSSSTWLSYSGRLEMLNAAITPITTYAMCTVKLPKGVIDNIDRAMKQYLCSGNTQKMIGGNLVA